MRISDCSSDVCSSDLLGEANADTLRLPAAPYLRSIWLDDAAGLGWARPVDELLARADAPDAPNDALLAAIEKEVAPGDDAVIVYTSGSTALPKAVVHTQANVARHRSEEHTSELQSLMRT